jgi:hypothetical protein
MSKSGKGTKKTTGFIDQGSPCYIERTDKGGAKMGKKGSAKEKTDASHILSWGVVNSVATHTRGRPLGDEGKAAVAKALNRADNLRIKSSNGNRVFDERRDARILDSFVNHKPIEGRSTAFRAGRVYESSKKAGDALEFVTKALGQLDVYDEATKRTHKLKNHAVHETRKTCK